MMKKHISIDGIVAEIERRLDKDKKKSDKKLESLNVSD
jgi:hypothetical protein